MKTQATIGYGTVIRIGVGPGPTWTTLQHVMDVEWPMAEADEHEATAMDSPDRTKEYIGGLNDNGEVTIPMNWVPGSPTDTVLTAIQQSGELVQIEFTANKAGATPETYSGFCKRYSRTSPVNGIQTAEAGFRINGQVA
jgi:hypothetical protein